MFDIISLSFPFISLSAKCLPASPSIYSYMRVVDLSIRIFNISKIKVKTIEETQQHTCDTSYAT